MCKRNGWDKVVHLRRGERRWDQLRTDQFRAGPSRLVEGAREAEGSKGLPRSGSDKTFHPGAALPDPELCPREEKHS